MSHYEGSVAGSKWPLARRSRRVVLPLVLFLLTCASTFWAGVAVEPNQYLSLCQQSQSLMPIRRVLLTEFHNGVEYMLAVVAILLTHEMGHFLATVRYRVPASFPFFLPLPITPIGTLGAVIGIEGRSADRKQIFDIGLAGPLAGLCVAIPVMWAGISRLNLQLANGQGGLRIELPLGAALMMKALRPDGAALLDGLWLGHLQGNPLLIAGWFGFLITGLNMLPVSQLDGGHVAYCLFGRRAHWIAWAFLAAVGVYIVLAEAYVWILMALLVFLMGPAHPPTRDDSVRLGVVRTLVGLISLAIPVLCLPLQPFHQ